MRGVAKLRCSGATLTLMGALSLPVLSCSSPTGIASSGMAPTADAGTPGGDADLAAAGGDSLPTGAISLFNRRSCPAGWEPLQAAAGRTLVPTLADSAPGNTAGEPLMDGEERAHTHPMPAMLNLPSVNYAGIVGEANHGVAKAGSMPMMVTGTPARAGLPYVQLLVCQKQAAPDPEQRPAPTGTLMFFQAKSCPDGWGRAGSPQGRILIGLPEGGTPGQPFGGKPLTAEERRPHRHAFTGQVKTSPHGIALLSGGAAGGYAKDGTIPYEGMTDEKDAELPYLQLLQCQKL